MPRDVQLEEALLPMDTISRGYVREGQAYTRPITGLSLGRRPAANADVNKAG